MSLCLCLSVCLSVSVSVSVSVCLSVCLSVSLSLSLSLSPPPPLSLSMFLSLPASLSICLSVCLPACLPVCLSVSHRLVGLVVRRPPRERNIPGLNPVCAGIFFGSSHTSDLKIGTPVATLPGAWRYRVSTGTGRPGVRPNQIQVGLDPI